MPRRVTIKDIARELGLSNSTISLAIHNKPTIPESTRKRVHETMERMGYVPNIHARSLVNSNSGQIAYVSQATHSTFYQSLVAGFNEALTLTEYQPVQYIAMAKPEVEDAIFRDILYSNAAEAVICVSASPRGSLLEEYRNSSIPLVFMEIDVPGFSSVTLDNYQGGFMATEYLINKGCKNIGFLAYRGLVVIGVSNAMDDRYRGYCDALAKHKLPLQKRNCMIVDVFEEAAVPKGIFQKFKDIRDVDGLFCAAGDIVCLNLISEALQSGVKIPEEIQFVGYDDLVIASKFNPSLSTIRQPLVEMGKTAAGIILDQLANKNSVFTPKRISFSPILIARETTR